MGIVTLLGLLYMIIIFLAKMISNGSSLNSQTILWFGDYKISDNTNNKQVDPYGLV